MNDLQVGLLMVGVVVLLILAGYSVWQVSRRAKHPPGTVLSEWHPSMAKEPSLMDAGFVCRGCTCLGAYALLAVHRQCRDSEREKWGFAWFHAVALGSAE